MPQALADLLEAIAGVFRRLAGLAAAMLPARYWSALDAYVPATSSAFPSSILTFLAAGAIGIRGFLDHIAAVADTNNRVLLGALGWYGEAVAPGAATADSSAFVAVGALGLFTFLFLTPAGWATTYLGLTGFLRAVGSMVDGPFGDPLLTGLDRALSHGRRSARGRRARKLREALEGPELPDRVVPAAQLGVENAELVIVASRVKPDWDTGTVLLCGDRCFRVGRIEERAIAGRVRTLYPLTEHRDVEAFRRTVVYDLPAPGRAPAGPHTPRR